MTRLADKHLEIHLNYSPAGFRSWSIMTRDLEFGLRHIETFFTKHEAVAVAERMSRRIGVDIRRGPMSAKQIKRAAYAKRQQRVARRLAAELGAGGRK